VDNSFSDESTLHRENDYMTYGGINRAVSLEFLQEAYIKYIHVTPSKKDDVWTANVSVAVENISDSDEDMTVSFVLDGKEYFFDSAKMAKKSVTTINADFTFENVNEWSMDEPNLYLIQAFLEIDEEVIDDLIERIGFRQVTLDGNKILINGKQIRIKGFNRHEDHPHFGCSLPYAAMVKDIEIIKDLNANSVRTSHYPNDEIFLDLCDEFGILVWEEHHARGFEEDVMRLPNFDKQCCDCIEEMIEQHYNHPAIYIWGILNECASHTEFGASCYKKQLELIESLDKSRPTTFASNKRYTDICFEYPTVISNNMYPFWYFDVPLEEILRKSIDYANQNSEKLKPFIVSEIGCGGIYGSRSRTREKWTEEGQLDILEKQIVPILEHDECIGVYIWQFCDVRVTPEWAMKRPRSYNNKGIVDEFRREKLAYDMVKRVFGSYSNYLDD
ncbi:MAG: glycoside hydrolase family 2 TIM barrel-domain containing protein, partial [Clostridia bacterium]